MNLNTMKCLAALVAACALCSAAQTDGTVTFTVETLNFNTSYDPRNIVAIWVVDSSGTFVKTLKKRAQTRQQYLYQWLASSGGNVVDAVTGATLPTQEVHTVTWNCRNTAGTVVQDGVYRIRAEYTMANMQGPYTTNWCEFVKGAAGYTTNYATMNGRFTRLSLAYAPIIVTHDIAALRLSPAWGEPGSIVPLTALVTNKEATAESFTVLFSNETANTLIGSASVAGLSGGAAANAAISWNTAGTPPGAYTLSASAGPIAGETFTSDNTVRAPFVVRAAVYDVALTSLQCASLVTPGAVAPVTVVAQNLGDDPASFTVTLRNETAATMIGVHSIASLASGASTNLSFSWNTAGLPIGFHTIAADASAVSGETDLLDNTNRLTVAIASGISTNTVVAAQGEWRYNDQGLDLHGAPWTLADYYDGTWSGGTAPLGYGGDGEATVLSYGPDANAKYPTYYFRKAFTAAQTPMGLTLHVRRDDGVIVYLNGIEIARDNMPGGSAYGTYASATVGGADETTYFAFTVADPSLVKPGVNILAAEVHQADPASSDMGFDARLVAIEPEVQAARDVALVSFSSEASAFAGDNAVLRIEVANKGAGIESVEVTVNDTTESRAIGTVTASGLAPGQTAGLALDWNTISAAPGMHVLEAVAAPVAGETNTADNALFRQIGISAVESSAGAASATGSIGGFASAVAAEGTVVYLAEGASLTVVDVANAAQPVILSRLQLPGAIRALATANGWVYAACGSRGVQIVDTGVLSAPRLVRGLATAGDACGLALSGGTLYIANGIAGLRIANVSDPASASLAGAYHTEGPAVAVAANSSTVYLLDSNNGLLIINAASPSSPALAGICDRIAAGASLALAGSHAYVADGEGVLSIVNISAPAAPVIDGQVFLPGQARGLAANGTVVYAAAGLNGLAVVDVSSPSSPALGAPWVTQGDVSGVAVNGAQAYVARGFAGLEVLNVSTPGSPSALGVLQTGARARGSAVAGGVLYAAAGGEGVRIYNVANPALPVLMGAYTGSSNAMDVAIDGTTLCVADGQFGVQIADVSSPAAPLHRATYLSAGLGAVRSVAVHGGLAFVSDGYGIECLDVSNPASPAKRAAWATNVFLHDVAADAGNVFVAAGSHGILALEYTTGGGLQLRGAAPTSGNTAVGVAAAGNSVYVADDAGGWHLVDASQPSALAIAKTKQLHMPVLDVSVAGSRLNVLDGRQGIHSYDVSLRLTPVERAVIEPLARAMRLTSGDRYAYVAQDDAGAAIVNVAPDDGDFDGMPDSFEQAIVDANPSDAITSIADVNPQDDYDGDGLPNFAEYVAGTDATDAQSVFAVRAARAAADGSLVLQWASVSNRTYAVYRSGDVANGFSAIETGIAATPPLNTYTGTVTASNAYYTVIIE
ncbi:DUF2271 domain-containing protein [bacterium]|nr:DUF2271 domain-containing protein [bacterium]